MINPFNFSKPRFIELSEILCANCRYRSDCFDMPEVGDCDTYRFANNNMTIEENK